MKICSSIKNNLQINLLKNINNKLVNTSFYPISLFKCYAFIEMGFCKNADKTLTGDKLKIKKQNKKKIYGKITKTNDTFKLQI